MHFFCTRLPNEANHFLRGRAAHQRIVNHHHPFAAPGRGERAGQPDNAGADDGEIELVRHGRPLWAKEPYQITPA